MLVTFSSPPNPRFSANIVQNSIGESAQKLHDALVANTATNSIDVKINLETTGDRAGKACVEIVQKPHKKNYNWGWIFLPTNKLEESSYIAFIIKCCQLAAKNELGTTQFEDPSGKSAKHHFPDLT